MNPTLAVLIVGALHAAYIFAGYGAKVFGLSLPYAAAIAVWLVLPSVVAAYFYWKASGRIAGFVSKPIIRSICVVVWLCTSSYAGIFLALNRFGS